MDIPEIYRPWRGNKRPDPRQWHWSPFSQRNSLDSNGRSVINLTLYNQLHYILNFIQVKVSICQVDKEFTSGISQAIVEKEIWKDFSKAMAGYVKL